MRINSASTVAQLLYNNPPTPNFARVVSSMEKALASFPAAVRRLDWTNDDIAIFDIDDCRIALALTEQPGDGHAACLSVSAGPSPLPPDEDGSDFVPQHLCSALVDRIVADLPADAVLWSEATGVVTVDTLDLLISALPRRTDIELLGPRHMDLPVEATATTDRQKPEPLRLVNPVPRRRSVKAAMPVQVKIEPANPVPAESGVVELRPRDLDLIRIRAALYPPEDEAAEGISGQSVQMRLAVHSMNATLLVVMLPLGAAMTTYTLLRGADMRATGRAMALGGFGLVLARMPMIQALIG